MGEMKGCLAVRSAGEVTDKGGRNLAGWMHGQLALGCKWGRAMWVTQFLSFLLCLLLLSHHTSSAEIHSDLEITGIG